MKTAVYQTTRIHKSIYTLLEEIRKAGWKGLATQSQYRGQKYPVIVLRDFSQHATPNDRRAGLFLGVAPIEVESVGAFRNPPGSENYWSMPVGELVAVWK